MTQISSKSRKDEILSRYSKIKYNIGNMFFSLQEKAHQMTCMS